MFSNFLAVGAGGAIGAMGRYAVGLIPALQRGAFPLHTLLINLGGAILIGMAAASCCFGGSASAGALRRFPRSRWSP